MHTYTGTCTCMRYASCIHNQCYVSSFQAVSSVILESPITSSSSDDDDIILRPPPKVPSGKSSPSQAKRTTKPSKSMSASVLTNVSLKSAPLVGKSNTSAAPALKTGKRIKVEKKEPRKLFPDSDSSSGEDDLLSTGISKPVATDTRTNHTHVGGASLEDLFDEPTVGGSDGLLLGNSKEGDSSSSDESIGSPEVALPRGLSMNISEDVISGAALEQLSKVHVHVHMHVYNMLVYMLIHVHVFMKLLNSVVCDY